MKNDGSEAGTYNDNSTNGLKSQDGMSSGGVSPLGDAHPVSGYEERGQVAQTVYPEPVVEMAEDEKKPKKKESGWLKFLRVVIWGVSIVGLCVGWGLYRRSSLMEYFLNGTSSAMRRFGIGLMVGFGILMLGNAVWGAIRWFSKLRRGNWKTGKIVGKLIGGGIWRGIVFSIVGVLAFIFLPGIIAKKFQPEKNELSTITKLEAAYQAGEITVSTYIKEAAYATFDPAMVSGNFKGENAIMCLDFLDVATENIAELDRETVIYITQNILMLDVGITNGKIADASSSSVWAADGVTDKINRLTLSNDGNFAVYWADSGVDQITEDQAENIGQMFERNVVRAKEIFGLDFDFAPKHEDVLDTVKNWLPIVDDWKPLKELAEKENIDFDSVKQAMPIYMISPGTLTSESGTGAFYSGESIIDWLSGLSVVFGAGDYIGEMGSHAMSIPMFPAITILPQFIDDPHMETITAHEFGHHFQHVYCGGACSLIDGEYNEAHANYFAARVVENQESVLENADWIRAHHAAYLRCSNVPLDADYDFCSDFGGYRNFGYLVNYAMEVEGGDGYVWEALKKGKNAYEWLTGKAEDSSRSLWKGILERNLTGDYGYIKVLTPSTKPQGMIEGHDFYHATNFSNDEGYRVYRSSVSRLSTKYYYIGGEDYVDDSVKTVSYNENLVVVFMGYDEDSEKWALIGEFEGQGEKTFDLGEYSDVYEKFAIGVANSGVEDSSYEQGFSIQFINGELVEIVDSEGLSEVDLGAMIGEGFWVSGNCFGFTTDNIFNAINLAYQFGKELGAEGMDESIAEIEKQRNETEFKKISICLIPVKEGVPMERIEELAARALGFTYKMSFVLGEESSRIVVGAGYDLWTNTSKIYMVAGEENGSRVLVSMRVE